MNTYEMRHLYGQAKRYIDLLNNRFRADKLMLQLNKDFYNLNPGGLTLTYYKVMLAYAKQKVSLTQDSLENSRASDATRQDNRISSDDTYRLEKKLARELVSVAYWSNRIGDIQ